MICQRMSSLHKMEFSSKTTYLSIFLSSILNQYWVFQRNGTPILHNALSGQCPKFLLPFFLFLGTQFSIGKDPERFKGNLRSIYSVLRCQPVSFYRSDTYIFIFKIYILESLRLKRFLR